MFAYMLDMDTYLPKCYVKLRQCQDCALLNGCLVGIKCHSDSATIRVTQTNKTKNSNHTIKDIC